MKYIVILVCFQLAWMHASAQATSNSSVSSDDMQFTLEALCSAEGAGARWSYQEPLAGLQAIQTLTYNCSNEMSGEVWTDDDDQCFIKLNKDAELVQSLTQTTTTSMFHAVSRTLPPGTVCTFNVTYKKNWQLHGPLQTRCTVKDSSTVRLPANCTYLNNSCQCSCSPGFNTPKSRADNGISGNICPEEVESNPVTIQLTTSSGFGQEVTSNIEVTPTSVMGIRASLSSETTIITTPEVTFSSAIPISSSPAMFSQSTQTESSIHPQTDDTELPTPAPPSNSLTLALSIVPIAVIIIGVMLLVLGVIEYRKYRLKRKHDKLAIPFDVLRFEKIDPDFNPIKIDERIFVSESMHSIFHTLSSLPEQDSEKQQTDTCKTDYSTDYDTESNITEPNSLADNVSIMSESEETILTDEQLKDSTDASSGYITDSFVYDSLCQQTSEYLESPLSPIPDLDDPKHQEDRFNAAASSFDDVTLPTARLEVSNDQSKHKQLGCQGEHSMEPLSSVRTGSDSGYVIAWPKSTGYVIEPTGYVTKSTGYITESTGYVIEPTYTQTVQAADYLLPSFSQPHVFFNFPKEILYTDMKCQLCQQAYHGNIVQLHTVHVAMGNAAGSSQVDSTQPENGQRRQESLPENLQESLAKKLHVSRSEVVLLYERFLQFGPNSKGLVDKRVFDRPPYSTDPFCRQIWMRIAEDRGNPNMISFVSFAKTMAWWHSASSSSKVEMLFSWVSAGSDSLTPSDLAKILSYTEMGLTKDELLVMAEMAIQLTVEEGGSKSSVGVPTLTSASFLKWCDKIPKEKLNNSLEFKISNS